MTHSRTYALKTLFKAAALTLALAPAAAFIAPQTANAADTFFTLGAGETLTSSVGNEIAADTFTFEADSTLAFDFAHASTSTPALILTGGDSGFTVDDFIHINLLALNGTDGLYTLVESLNGDFTDKIGTVSLRGATIAGTRAAGLITLGYTGGITLTQAPLDSTVSTWTGGDAGDWNIADVTWNGSAQFLHGDAVNFANGTDAPVSIALNPAGDGTVLTAGIHFSGSANYAFTDGLLEADASLSTVLTDDAAQGKFVLGALAADLGSGVTSLTSAEYSGTVDLTGTGANRFAGGVEIYSGTLRIGDAAQLGAPLSALAFLADVDALSVATPTLLLASGETVTFDGTGQRLSIGAAMVGAIYTEADSTFVIAHNVASGDGGAVALGNGAQLDFTGTGDFIFRENQTTGSGGAIYNNAGTVAFTDASFSGNTAIGVVGGAILSYSGIVTLNVSAGKTAVFTGNLDSSGANSITLVHDNILPSQLNVVTAGGATPGVLDMRDPLSAIDGHTEITKSGAGTWKLGGTSILDRVDQLTPADATFAVSEGTLYLYRAGEVPNPNANDGTATVGAGVIQNTNGIFNLAASATLASGGGNTIRAANIVFEADSTLAFNFTNANPSDLAWLTLSATTAFGGEVIGAGDISIYNAYNLVAGQTYTLVDVVSMTYLVAATGTVTVTGPEVNSARGSAARLAYTLVADNSAEWHRLLKLAVSTAPALDSNTTLTWAGTTDTGGDIWRDDNNTLLAPNWIGVVDGEDVTTFLNGDTVLFDDTADQVAVAVETGGVTAAAVTIDTAFDGTDAYVFSGGTVAVTGVLLKTGTGEVTFENAFTVGTLDVQDGVFTASSSTSRVTGAVSVTGGATLILPSDIFGEGATRTLDDGTVDLTEVTTFGGDWAIEAGGGTLEVATGEVAFTGTVTGEGTVNKTGDGKLVSTAPTFAEFEGTVNIAAGTWGISEETFERPLTGVGILEVTLAEKGTTFTFGEDVGGVFAGTVLLTQGTIALDIADNAAALAASTLALTADSRATIDGTDGAQINTLALGGGELVFDNAGETHSPLLTLTGALDVSDGGAVQIVVSSIDPAAPVASENLFSLWENGGYYQRQLIAADSVVPLTGDATLSVRPIDPPDSRQLRLFTDGTGAARFDYAATLKDGVGEAGLWLGYGLVDITAYYQKTVTLDATGIADARLLVPLTGAGGFRFTGAVGQPVILGSTGSTYTGDTWVTRIALTLSAANALGGKGALTLANQASVDSTNFAQTFTTLVMYPATALTASALTLENGGVVDGAVSVTGTANVAGAVSGSGVWTVAQLNNSGNFKAGAVVGNVVNTDTFAVSGSITGNFTNSGDDAVATLRDVTGAVSNRGGIIHLGGDATWGALDNSSGYLDFVNAGRTLRVASLHAEPGETGLMRLDVDLVDFTQSDRLVVDGAITGRHEFDLVLAHNFDVNEVTRDSGNFPYISAGAHGNESVFGFLRDVGLYDFVLAWDDVQSAYVLLPNGSNYSTTAQAALNSAGVAPIAWFSQLDSFTKRFGDLRLAASVTRDEGVILKASSLSDAFWLHTNAQRANVSLGLTGVGDFRETQYGAEVGYDHALRNFASFNDALYVGGFAAFQSAHRTFDGGVGKGDTDSVAFGGYASWLHKEGWYLDSVLKAQYFDTDYSSSAVHGAFSNYAFGLLLDFGRRFSFANGAFIEPEVQFNYAHIFTEDYTTTNGLRIRSEDNDILRFGLSVRAGWTFDLGGNGRLSPFVEAGVELQESTGGLVRAAHERWTPSTDGTRVNVGLGITWQLDDAQQIRFDYDAKFGDRYEKPWGVNLGYRYRF